MKIQCQPWSDYNPLLESGLFQSYSQCMCVYAFLHMCVWFLPLDLLDLGISPAACSVVRVGLTQFLCVKLATLWTDLAVEVSLCRVVVITQLDRIRHWLTWQYHAVKTNSELDSRLGMICFSGTAMESVTTGLFLCDDIKPYDITTPASLCRTKNTLKTHTGYSNKQ